MNNKSHPKETVVIGTVFPGLEIFLENYLDSLEKQSCNNFDLLIANDGMNGLDRILAERNLSVTTIIVNSSISSNRRELICKAIESGYRKVIFTDCDDVLEGNHIEVLDFMLEKNSIVVNDLDIIDSDGRIQVARYFLKRYKDAEMIFPSSLQCGNIMGLSNTAARTNVFGRCPALISGDSLAFDWYLWSSVLMEGHKARFTSRTSTKYRIHNSNTAGLPQPLTEKNVIKGIMVKNQHYGLMSKVDKSYLKLAKEFRWLAGKVEDKNSCLEYIDALKKHEIKNHIWWENIRAPSEVNFK